MITPPPVNTTTVRFKGQHTLDCARAGGSARKHQARPIGPPGGTSPQPSPSWHPPPARPRPQVPMPSEDRGPPGPTSTLFTWCHVSARGGDTRTQRGAGGHSLTRGVYRWPYQGRVC